MNITISNKGWVVIPAELRKKYHLKPGSTVQVVDYGGVLALVPTMSDTLRETQGMMTAHKGEKPLTQALLEEHQQERQRGK